MTFLGLIFILLLWLPTAHADTIYTFSCPESSVGGSIHYSVVGVYHAKFNDCTGRIVVDRRHHNIKSVLIKIKAGSIVSPLEWCDNIVRSRRVLNIQKFPWITFKSKYFKYDGQTCLVFGRLSMHGYSRELDSSFKIEREADKQLVLKGRWTFNRKNFHVIWSRILDHGGVIVGDRVTVDWKVKAHKIQG